MNNHAPLLSFDPYPDRVANAFMLQEIILAEIGASTDVMLKFSTIFDADQLPEASGVTELADPMRVWASAAVGTTAKSTTSGSAEIQSWPHVLVRVVIARG